MVTCTRRSRWPTRSSRAVTPRESIRFLGASRGLEARAVPDAGYDDRPSPVARLPAWPHARARRRQPADDRRDDRRDGRGRCGSSGGCGREVVVGVGGYASVPGILAARAAAHPGRDPRAERGARGSPNKLAARLGARVAVSFPGHGAARRRGRRQPGARVAGVARSRRRTRTARCSASSAAASARRGSTMRRWTSTTGGVRAATSRSVTSRASSTTTTAGPGSTGCTGPQDTLVYELVPYEDHMDRFYGTPSLAVCRAGAVTVAELAAAGVPSVLVPWPGAAGDHQTRQRAGHGGSRRGGARARRRRPTARASTRWPGSCSWTRTASRRCRTRRAGWPAPMPRTGSPISSRRPLVPAPEPGPVLDLTEPRRIHVVGVGGAGMSAYAAILAEMGHRSAARTCTSTPASTGCGCSGWSASSRRSPRTSRRCRRGRDQLGGAADQRRGGRGRARSGSRSCRAPMRSPGSSRRAAASASPARTARRRPRR